MSRRAGRISAALAVVACAGAQTPPRAVGIVHEIANGSSCIARNADWAFGSDAAGVGELRAVSFVDAGAPEQLFESSPEEFEPFDECLVSWNARHSRSTGFGVEISVARSIAGPFSPWMWIGEWNVSARPETLVVAHEDARIDVDTFTSDSTWRALRYRIRVRTEGSKPAGFALHRFTVMPTLRASRGRAGAPAAPVARLTVPFRSQRVEEAAIAGRICSPTSLSMVLAFHGVNATTAEVARRAYDPFHDIYGNWNRAIQTAYSFGVPGRLERIGDWARAEELVKNGQPLIVSIAAKPGELHGAPYESTSGHLLVLCGFDEHGDVLVNDPAAKSALVGQSTYSRAEFEKVWLARGGTAYVLEASRKAAR